MHPLHAVAHNVLAALIPGADQDIIREVRTVALQRRGPLPATWQEALNAFSGATPDRPGTASFHMHRPCPNCHGRKWDPRTGRPCPTCATRGRTYQQVTVTIRYAPLPDTPASID